MDKYKSTHLVSLLKFLKFEDSKFTHPNINSGIFKNPNKDLFRKIVCFLFDVVGNFDSFVQTYSAFPLPGTIEAQFRFSMKDMVFKLNEMYPFGNLSPINPSHLITPYGTKVITFLINFCKVVVKVKLKRTLPSQGKILSYLSDNCVMEEEDKVCLLNKIDVVKAELGELEILHDREKCSISDDIKKICVNSTIKTQLLNNEVADKTLLDWKMALFKDIANRHSELKCISDVTYDCNCLLNEIKTFKEAYPMILDGHSILNDLGFKNNVFAQIKGVDLIKNGKLKLLSLFEIAKIKLAELNTVMDPLILDNIGAELDLLLESLITECSNFHVLKNELNWKLEKCVPRVNKIINEIKENSVMSQDSFSKKLNENLLFYSNSSMCITDKKEFSVSNCSLPKNLSDWVLGNSRNSVSLLHDRSTKNSVSKFIRSSPSLGRKFCNKKLELSSKGKPRDNPCKKPIFGLKPSLLGMCGEDRRATLASPVARRERFRIKHIDEKRKPLKPMNTKSILFSSSPLSESTAKMLSFGEESKVENVDECLISTSDIVIMNPSTSSGSNIKPDANNSFSNCAEGCGFSITKCSPNTTSSNLSLEVLKWNLDSSGTDDSLTEPLFNSEPTSRNQRQLNESTEFLVAQYESLKQKLNMEYF